MAAVEAGDRAGLAGPVRRRRRGGGPHRPVAVRPRGDRPPRPAAIAAFYDAVIAANESIRFDIPQSFQCGDELANVGVIRITFSGGTAVEVDGVYTYRRSPDGKIAALRAYWEPDDLRTSAQRRGRSERSSSR